MVSLGGTIFTHNCFKYDYCIKESLDCLLSLCDEVVCLDAESTDETYDYLIQLADKNPKLKIIESKWEQPIAEGKPAYDKLRILADEARKELTTDWHIMLQSDEIIHESCFDTIRSIIEGGYQSIGIIRLNLYGSFNNHIRFDSPKRPCGDYITRLALTSLPVEGDAENIRRGVYHLKETKPPIYFFHYGMVRNPYIFVDKVIDMGVWFWDGNPDQRYVQLKKEGKPFDPKLIDGDMLMSKDLPLDHPKFAKQWVEERRHFYER